MAGNDKPNLSDLKARLSFKLGEQKAVQSPTPQSHTSGLGQQTSSNQQWSQGAQPQAPGQQGGGQNMWDDDAPAYHQSQPGVPGQQVRGNSGYQSQVGGAMGQPSSMGQQPSSMGQQPAMMGQQPSSPQYGAQQNFGQHQPPMAGGRAPQASQPQGQQPGAPVGVGNREPGGLKDLEASFESGPSFDHANNDIADFKGNSVITLGGVVIAICAFILGGVFAYLYTVGAEKRQLYEAHIKDANEAYNTLKPAVVGLDELRLALSKMGTKDIDFQAVDNLAKIPFTVEGSPFSSTRVLLGSKIITPIMNYLVDTATLKQMIVDHIRLTNAEKESLESLTGEGALAKYEYFAVTFDYKKACETGTNPDYVPSPGAFVALPTLKPNSNGDYDVKFVNSGQQQEVAKRFLIPIKKKDVIAAQGVGNPLQQYTKRLEAIKRRVAAIDYAGTMLESLEVVAKEPAPGFFSLK